MRTLRRSIIALAFAAVAALTGISAAPAAASTTQEALFQDGPSLRANPVGTLTTLHDLGVTRVRLLMPWSSLTPRSRSFRRPRFKSMNPSAYPARNWRIYDTIISTAKAEGISVDLDPTGPAPLWATGRGMPRRGPYGQWKPSDAEFYAFVKAVGTRYSGRYHGLPRVSFWSVWNEPNYGPDLAPQATRHDTVELSGAEYRGLVEAQWSALHATGHGRDTFLIGETAPHGLDHPIGNFSGMKPLRFLRALYCVDRGFRPLRGGAAAVRGCPATAAGSRRFRAHNPGLFSASGYAAHLYAQGVPPNRSLARDADYADLAAIGHLERTLDRLQRVYRSHRHLGIWNTEYGFQTRPPERVAKLSPATAAYYINWAEYISYRNPRVRSYAQYLLVDPPAGNFASGLILPNGVPKATFAAYRMPLYLPVTSMRRTHRLEVWGGVRPAHLSAGAAPVAIQYRAGSRGPFLTVATIDIVNRRGYFDVRQTFPGPGAVRLAWSAPSGQVMLSRTVSIG